MFPELPKFFEGGRLFTPSDLAPGLTSGVFFFGLGLKAMGVGLDSIALVAVGDEDSDCKDILEVTLFLKRIEGICSVPAFDELVGVTGARLSENTEAF